MNLIGMPLAQLSAGPILEQVTTGYEFTLPYELKLLQKSANFVFSYKLTDVPRLTSQHFDLFLFGEVTKEGEVCNLPQNQKHDFIELEDRIQIVITERAANCALQALVDAGFTQI